MGTDGKCPCPSAFPSPSLTPVLMGTVLLVTHPAALSAGWETCSLHPDNDGTATATAFLAVK